MAVVRKNSRPANTPENTPETNTETKQPETAKPLDKGIPAATKLGQKAVTDSQKPKTVTVEIPKATATMITPKGNVKMVEKPLGVYEDDGTADKMRLMIQIGATINTGDMEFAKILIGVDVPCYEETKDDVFEEQRAWIDSKLETIINQINATREE